LNIRKKIYLNFSSIPDLSKMARERRMVSNNTSLEKLIYFSKKKKLFGVEFPFFRFFKKTNMVINLKNYLNRNNQKYILDCEKKISKRELVKLIILSKDLKSKFIRLKCSNILSCERFKYKKKWNYKINSIIKKINEIKPLLKKYNVKLAIENHQDLDSNDLLNIIRRVGKDYVGINFDVGNAFATCELPKDFFKKTRKYILNIHLKDYIILPTKNGYELHRCPIMDGDSQILEIINLIKKYKLKAPLSLELGAKTPRNIKVKSNKFINFFITDKKTKLKNINLIMKIAQENLIKTNKIQKLISLNEISMIDKSLKNFNHYKI
jgi:sugar phosphate isomerase/epimerase